MDAFCKDFGEENADDFEKQRLAEEEEAKRQREMAFIEARQKEMAHRIAQQKREELERHGLGRPGAKQMAARERLMAMKKRMDSQKDRVL